MLTTLSMVREWLTAHKVYSMKPKDLLTWLATMSTVQSTTQKASTHRQSPIKPKDLGEQGQWVIHSIADMWHKQLRWDGTAHQPHDAHNRNIERDSTPSRLDELDCTQSSQQTLSQGHDRSGDDDGILWNAILLRSVIMSRCSGQHRHQIQFGPKEGEDLQMKADELQDRTLWLLLSLPGVQHSMDAWLWDTVFTL